MQIGAIEEGDGIICTQLILATPVVITHFMRRLAQNG